MSQNKKLENYGIVPPCASDFCKTFSGFGYSIKSAVSDIIDNSISANASTIYISFSRLEEEPYVLIFDNGKGMTSPVLAEAMRFAVERCDRGSEELGRFGMGLKTASLSQCRRLVVASKAEERLSACCWDLDLLEESKEWRLQFIDPEELDSRFDVLRRVKSGTVVLWEKMSKETKDIFWKNNELRNLSLLNVKNQVGMVFHRFIESGRVEIFFLNKSVEPLNPFDKKRVKHADPLEIYERSKKTGEVEKVSATTFLLQPSDDEKNHKFAQGIYIYREGRLLSAGGWLSLRGLKPDSLYDQAAVRVEFDKSSDETWRLDITKSRVQIPAWLISFIKHHAEKARRYSENERLDLSKKTRPVRNKENRGVWTMEGICQIESSSILGRPFFELCREGTQDEELLESYFLLISLAHPKSREKSLCPELGKALAHCFEFYKKKCGNAEEAKNLLRNQWPFFLTNIEQFNS
ncbi:ATP-binding protein [Turicimonas muris]|uniref:ATP-binding protein n=1 Tax=Turicimonas muris TaxID=1796652 RepID=UPI0024940C0B|nr:ATP-binding protein [Turicimonas muris]